MKSILDKIKLTGNDAVKFAGLVITACGLYYGVARRMDSIEAKVDKIVILDDADKKIIESKITGVQVSQREDRNKINDLEKRLFRLMAILPQNVKREEE